MAYLFRIFSSNLPLIVDLHEAKRMAQLINFHRDGYAVSLTVNDWSSSGMVEMDLVECDDVS
jgi:hypothetical protein